MEEPAMKMLHKFSPGAVVPDRTLGARQIKVVASDATEDRDGDILLPQGCDFSAYNKNPIVLDGHDQSKRVGTAAVSRTPSAIEAIISFARLGASQAADEACALAKDGVLSAISVGFRPITAQPRGNGRGVLWKAWELLEISLVSVPSNPNAVVLERSYAKDGRVLAGQHADALMRAHQRISGAQKDVASVLAAAGRPPTDEDPEDSDQELAFNAARLKRARAAQLADLDRIDLGAAMKAPAPPRELRGGPWLTKWVREQEEARLRSFWDRR
jgi:HK97 family phage prohead protease